LNIRNPPERNYGLVLDKNQNYGKNQNHFLANMKIAIDARVFQLEQSGVYRSAFQTINVLKHHHEVHLIFSSRRTIDTVFSDDPRLKIHSIGPSTSMFCLFWENWVVPRLLASLGIDIYYCPSHHGIPIIKNRSIRYIITFHDILPIRYPFSFKPQNIIKWLLSSLIAARNADTIIAVSNFTANEIRRFLLVPLANIRILPWYIQEEFHPIPNDKWEESPFQDAYIIYHGGYRSYKNVRKVIQIYRDLVVSGRSELKLVLVGLSEAPSLRRLTKCFPDGFKSGRVITTRYLNDQVLASYLRHASCQIYMSEYEGFGFPPLEAMACGTPVICSSKASMPEIYGNAPIWIRDSDSPMSITSTLKMILKDHDVWTACRNAGLQQSRLYSKSRFSENLLKIFQEHSATR
jgi:glycosyltransferase involved in cell wall biosynthesis